MSRRVVFLLATLAAAIVAVLQPRIIIVRHAGVYKVPLSPWALEIDASSPQRISIPKRGNSVALKVRGLRWRNNPIDRASSEELPEVLVQGSTDRDDAVTVGASVRNRSEEATILPKYVLHPGEVVAIKELANFGLTPIEVRLVPASASN